MEYTVLRDCCNAVWKRGVRRRWEGEAMSFEEEDGEERQL